MPPTGGAELLQVPRSTGRYNGPTMRRCSPAAGRTTSRVPRAGARSTTSHTANRQDDQWHVASCQCGEEIGKVRKSGTPGGGTVRFAKWAVAVHGRDAGSVRYPVSNFLVSDMLELVQAHGSHRFVIEDSSHKARLIAWVFNPSVRISFRRPAAVEKGQSGKSHKLGSTLAAPQGRTLRAAKIMYKVGDNTENAGQCERLTYPADVCDALIAALKASTALYPEQRRRMGEWEMGFLERI